MQTEKKDKTTREIPLYVGGDTIGGVVFFRSAAKDLVMENVQINAIQIKYGEMRKLKHILRSEGSSEIDATVSC